MSNFTQYLTYMQLIAYTMPMTTHFPFPLSLAVWGHVLGGALALLCFMIPLFSRKGGRLHIRSGWVYAGAMILVSMSAFLITPWRFFVDPGRNEASKDFAFFLFFIAVFSLASLQQGIFVFRHKTRSGRIASIGSFGLPVLLFLISALILSRGAVSQNWLFVIFGLLAGSLAVKQIKYWMRPVSRPKDWWFFHLENMFTCSIATVTAFFVTAVPRIFPEVRFDSIWIWLAPTLVLAPWQVWFIRKYERQFGVKK